jgi:hypothetical protein
MRINEKRWNDPFNKKLDFKKSTKKAGIPAMEIPAFYN